MQETCYAMIIVAVREGFSDDVIDTAVKAGANGGSVIRGRRRGSEAVVQFLGISMQEEQDFVMIIVPKGKRNPISCRKSAPSAGFSPKHTVSSFPSR